MKPHNSALKRGALVAIILTVTLVIFTFFSLTVLVTAENSKQTKNAQAEESASKQQNSQLDSHQKDHQQQQQVVAQTSSERASSAAQPLAEKKQGDAASSASGSLSSTQDLFGGDEYVQIKPEEITVNENGKEEYTSGGQQASSQDGVDLAQQQQKQQVAEHKSSADDELNAHLAFDSISQQESAYRPSYAQPMHAQRARPKPYPMSRPAGPAQQYKQAPLRPIAPQSPPSSYQTGARPQTRLPPSYITLKGKLTGINSIISQYPHPAPGYPHQGPRHLPRGAAAGYAAFRDFVKAHASKYRSPMASASPLGTLHPPSTLAVPQAYNNNNNNNQQAQPIPNTSYDQSYPSGAYKQAALDASAQPVAAGPVTPYQEINKAGYKAPSGQSKTKVTIAQAYIPHPIKSQQTEASSAYNSQQSSSQYVNPILAKLYGGHAPQGAGKTEYNKDYGMVIHYPQATVYTEPMTVDQLHKLTGAGISQVLEQLRYNLANGYRDESNTIRATSKHNLGHGISIHAKEYYAPGKSGQYVPTTAAVISTSQTANKYNSGEQEQTNSYEQASNSESAAGAYGSMLGQKAVELGSGYERVKQAVANSQEKYNGNNKYGGNQAPNSDIYQPQQAQTAPQHLEPSTYGEQPSPKLIGNGEPLSAITNLLGSELESLYKANAALTKHIEPEIQQAITKAMKGYGKSQALRYTELGQGSPSTPYSGASAPANNQNRPRYPMPPQPQPQPQPHPNRYSRFRTGGPRMPRRGPNGGNRYPPQRGLGGPRYRGPNVHRPPQYGPQRPTHSQRPGPYRQPQSQQQSQAYHAAEQALNQQMMQFLQDFQISDEQYGGKNLPNTVNQGYPYKIMQKYNQNQNQKYGNQQQTNSQYNHQEGLEIPQGPNDQIGEIADLIESLRGALDLSKPDGGDPYSNQKQQQQQQGKSEEVRYLASALGQTPSYALQVPVSNSESGSSYDAPKKGSGVEQAAYQQPQQGAYQQPQQGAYQQAQQAYAPAQPVEAQGNYQANQQVQQPQQYEQAPMANYQQAGSSETYGQRAQASTYGGQQQSGQQQAVSAYGPAQQYGQQQQASGDYQQQQAAGPQQGPEYSGPIALAAPQVGGGAISSYGGGPNSSGSSGAGSYAQQTPVEPSLSQYAAAAPATVSEHTSVINHLVPVQSSPQPNQQASYESTAAQTVPQQQQQQPQPAHQIAIAAPTESQYQQAQSLSSFVDGLSSEYQELLRQPALLDNSSVSHLAIPEVSSYSSNNTASAPASQNYDNQQSASNKVSSSQQLVQTYQQQAKGQHQSTSGNTRQYSTARK